MLKNFSVITTGTLSHTCLSASAKNLIQDNFSKLLPSEDYQHAGNLPIIIIFACLSGVISVLSKEPCEKQVFSFHLIRRGLHVREEEIME